MRRRSFELKALLRVHKIVLVAVPLLACAHAEPKPTTPLAARFVAAPDDAQVNYDLGQSAERSGDLVRAEQYYRRVDALRPSQELAHRALHRLISVLAHAQRYQEAHDRCVELLSRFPDDRETRFLLAAILVSLARPAAAAEELDLLRRSKPDEPRAWYELGTLYRDEMGDRTRADAMFRRFLELAPDAPEAAALRLELAERKLAGDGPTPIPVANPPPTPAPPSTTSPAP